MERALHYSLVAADEAAEVAAHHEQAALLGQATELVRSIGDPLLLVRAASGLLTIDGTDSLLEEAQAAVARIALAPPNEGLMRCARESEAVRQIERLYTP